MSLDTKAEKNTQPIDAWKTAKETWEYVTLPEEDPLGKAFPSISLNKHIFNAGKTYLVPKVVALYVNDRIKVFNKSCVRLLQPNVDMKSLSEVSAGSANAPGQYVDASQVSTT